MLNHEMTDCCASRRVTPYDRFTLGIPHTVHARVFLILKRLYVIRACKLIHSVKANLRCCISPQVVQDWKFVARVLDRVFLWVFLSVSVLGSALLFIPVIYKWANIIVPNYVDNSS